MSSINFVIGNTYTKISDSSAALDRTGVHRKVHDWILYVDVMVVDDNDDNADLIKKVEFNLGRTFDPQKFVSYCPIKLGSSTNRRWRFQTRQQTYGPVSAKIAIIGRGGTVLRRDFRVALSPGGDRTAVDRFVEHRPNKPLAPIPMADTKFGIELELSSDISHGDVARLIEAKASVVVKDMTDFSLAAADSRTDIWRLVPDSSLQCSLSSPNCNTFELVSPILQGGAGLGEVDRVARALGNITSIKINKSMGFHVHVNVQSLSLDKLKNVCQNFVKYEEAMDKLMPESRRESNYCKSNRSAFGGPETPNKVIHDMIANCTSKDELGKLMSPTKYYKLNMCPLVSRRQPTIEFRQHSGTCEKEKVKNWIRFCVAFVHNSVKFRTPSHLASTTDSDKAFEMLFMHVVKDRSLRDFYRKRSNIFLEETSSCCDGCTSGGGCVADSHPSKIPRH